MRNDTSSKLVGRRGWATGLGWLAAANLLLALLVSVELVHGLQEEAEALTPQQRAARAIGTAESTARQVLLLSREADFAVVNERDSGLQALLDRGKRLLAFAKDGLAKAEQSQSATGYSDAALLARRATRQFETYEENLREAFARLEAERKPSSVVPPAPPPPAAVTTQPEPPVVDESVPAEEPTEAPSGAPMPGIESDSIEPVSAAETPGESAPVEPSPSEPEATPSAESSLAVTTPATTNPSDTEAEPDAQPHQASAGVGPALAQMVPPPQAISAPEPVPPPPPPSRSPTPPTKLRRAVDAFFAGDYEETVRLLGTIPSSPAKTRAHALLLRSAARYTLFLLGGETDYALRGMATADVTACRKADRDLVPDEEVFSPRFRDFFAGTQ